MPPRIRVGEGFRLTSSREDGRFFAALRMTCFAIALGENVSVIHSPVLSSFVSLPAGESSAGRLTKDLLRHRLASWSLVCNRRNRRHNLSLFLPFGFTPVYPVHPRKFRFMN